MSPDALLYPLADAIGLKINVMNEAGICRLRGAEQRDLKIGPWKVPTDVVLCSDEIGLDRASLVVRVTANLWLYLVNDRKAFRLTVFDGGALGLKAKDVATVGQGAALKTLAYIDKGVRAQYEHDGNKWVFLDSKNPS